MDKELKEFYQLFDMAPNLAILDINNNYINMTQALNDLVLDIEGNITTVEYTNLDKEKAKIRKAAYEYGVISDCFLESEDKRSMMELINRGVRDSGHIIILEKKGKSLQEIYTLFEEFDIGAVSIIDIFKEYDLIMGKKLHMWGM
ncbi:MAG: hypothetical protein U9Q33_09765 [Campylobacterota bacterium]|nr:hypothetical protein [Campylobacterota bacterium]